MKQNLNILLFSLLMVIAASVLAPKVHAYVPDLEGYVKTRTGLPVRDVWVKWQESDGGPDPERYAKTDATGRFFFLSQTATYNMDPTDPEYNAQYNTYIDTNLDGVNDARMRSIPYDEYNHFGCYQNPHHFSVVTPSGWTGTFDDTETSLVEFANIHRTLNLGTIYYDPATPQVFTPPPSQTPVAGTGTLRVCKVIMNITNNLVTDGSEYPGTQFVAPFINRTQVHTYESTHTPSNITFTTPLTLNTRLDGYPAGPSGSGNNAQCTTISIPLNSTADRGLPNEYDNSIFYNKEQINSSTATVWDTPKYNDGWNSAATQDNAFTYDEALWDSDSTNNTDRNDNSDGLITFFRVPGYSRTLVLQNRIAVEPAPVGCADKASCSQKQVVNVSRSFGITYSPLATINATDEPWIRLEINGHQSLGTTPTNVTVFEQVNNLLYEILPPEYTASAKTFFVTKREGTTEQDITPAICGASALSCLPLAGRASDRLEINLDAIKATDKRYVYIKVRPLRTTSGAEEVDNNLASRIRYRLGTPIDVALDDAQVRISEIGGPFFQTFIGNVFSASPLNPSVESLLPVGRYFINSKGTNASVGMSIVSGDSMEFGRGSISEKEQQIKNYTILEPNLSYSVLLERYKDKLVNNDDVNIEDLNITPSSQREHYILVNDDLDNSSGDWQDELVGKQVVIFVSGTLHIKEDIRVRADGRSSLVFIVQNNIGIDPDVERVEGVYITDGKIDTACNNGQFNNSQCGPNFSDTPLKLYGMFAAKNGFELERNGTPGTVPGEEFHFRPDMLFSTTETLGTMLYDWQEVSN